MSDSIPYKDLKEGLRLTLGNVNSLIDTASLLFNNKKFLHSAVFSVLAIEEMAKAQLLKENCSNQKDVSIAEWNRITRGKSGKSAHVEKMMDYLKAGTRNADSIRKYPKRLQDSLIDMMARYHNRLKKNVLYVNWDERLSKWEWYPEQYSEEQQEKISVQLLDSARKGYERHQVG